MVVAVQCQQADSAPQYEIPSKKHVLIRSICCNFLPEIQNVVACDNVVEFKVSSSLYSTKFLHVLPNIKRINMVKQCFVFELIASSC